jgi:hypothetical protein
VAALAIDHPGDWKWIASQLGNGHCRSGEMVHKLGLGLLGKLKTLGMEIESGRDIEFVPDAVFEQQKMPIGFECQELVAVFEAKKALLANLPPPPASIQPGPAPVDLSRPPPPSASILLSRSAPPEPPHHFRESDDERLRAIMSGYPERLRAVDWQRIADEFGCGLTVGQLQRRWFNYAKPGFDRSPFTLSERRQVAALAIDHPGEWKWIASQVRNGRCPSAQMVKKVGQRLLEKLRDLGVEIESGRDIEFVPDSVFGPGRPTGFEREEIVAQFNAAKAQHTTAAAAAGESFGDGSAR